jgi:hypothetical protein
MRANRRALLGTLSITPFAALGASPMTPLVAEGQFKVQMKPLSEPETRDGVSLGELRLSKQFEGDLVAAGEGRMLTAMMAQPGSAGYVAIERVNGRLHGRSGSFVMQHQGVMDRGSQTLSVRIVPDSGTGELAGISGEFKIRIEGGVHYYALHYQLPTP